MTRQTPDQFSVLIGQTWSAADDPEALKTARSAIFGQLAFLAAANQAADHTDLFYGAMWLEEFFAAQESTFFFGVHEAGTVIGKDEAVVANQSRRMWRIDTACPAGRAWKATFTAVGNGHTVPPAQADPATITMALRVDTIRALIMATISADTGDSAELRLARQELLWMIRHELRTNPRRRSRGLDELDARDGVPRIRTPAFGHLDHKHPSRKPQ